MTGAELFKRYKALKSKKDRAKFLRCWDKMPATERQAAFLWLSAKAISLAYPGAAKRKPKSRAPESVRKWILSEIHRNRKSK